MKIYCKLCDKVQPVIIDNCRDAKTNAPFQDIVCKECHLVIAAGTDIQREWVGSGDLEDSNAYQTQPQPAQEPWSDEHLQFLNFLYGAGEFDGVWFDQKHPKESGEFWWRAHLRRLFDAPPQEKNNG